MKLYFKTNRLTKEDKKRVRTFLKDYDTNGLTIIFTENWTQRFKHKGRFKWFSLGTDIGKYFYNSKYFRGYLLGVGGVKNLCYPVIAVRINDYTLNQDVNSPYFWFNVFLHELGHHLDYKTNYSNKYECFKDTRKRMKEKYAEDFAELTAQVLNKEAGANYGIKRV